MKTSKSSIFAKLVKKAILDSSGNGIPLDESITAVQDYIRDYFATDKAKAFSHAGGAGISMDMIGVTKTGFADYPYVALAADKVAASLQSRANELSPEEKSGDPIKDARISYGEYFDLLLAELESMRVSEDVVKAPPDMSMFIAIRDYFKEWIKALIAEKRKKNEAKIQDMYDFVAKRESKEARDMEMSLKAGAIQGAKLSYGLQEGAKVHWVGTKGYAENFCKSYLSAFVELGLLSGVSSAPDQIRFLGTEKPSNIGTETGAKVHTDPKAAVDLAEVRQNMEDLLEKNMELSGKKGKGSGKISAEAIKNKLSSFDIVVAVWENPDVQTALFGEGKQTYSSKFDLYKQRIDDKSNEYVKIDGMFNKQEADLKNLAKQLGIAMGKMERPGVGTEQIKTDKGIVDIPGFLADLKKQFQAVQEEFAAPADEIASPIDPRGINPKTSMEAGINKFAAEDSSAIRNQALQIIDEMGSTLESMQSVSAELQAIFAEASQAATQYNAAIEQIEAAAEQALPNAISLEEDIRVIAASIKDLSAQMGAEQAPQKAEFSKEYLREKVKQGVDLAKEKATEFAKGVTQPAAPAMQPEFAGASASSNPKITVTAEEYDITKDVNILNVTMEPDFRQFVDSLLSGISAKGNKYVISAEDIPENLREKYSMFVGKTKGDLAAIMHAATTSKIEHGKDSVNQARMNLTLQVANELGDVALIPGILEQTSTPMDESLKAEIKAVESKSEEIKRRMAQAMESVGISSANLPGAGIANLMKTITEHPGGLDEVTLSSFVSFLKAFKSTLNKGVALRDQSGGRILEVKYGDRPSGANKSDVYAKELIEAIDATLFVLNEMFHKSDEYMVSHKVRKSGDTPAGYSPKGEDPAGVNAALGALEKMFVGIQMEIGKAKPLTPQEQEIFARVTTSGGKELIRMSDDELAQEAVMMGFPQERIDKNKDNPTRLRNGLMSFVSSTREKVIQKAKVWNQSQAMRQIAMENPIKELTNKYHGMSFIDSMIQNIVDLKTDTMSRVIVSKAMEDMGITLSSSAEELVKLVTFVKENADKLIDELGIEPYNAGDSREKIISSAVNYAQSVQTLVTAADKITALGREMLQKPHWAEMNPTVEEVKNLNYKDVNLERKQALENNLFREAVDGDIAQEVQQEEAPVSQEQEDLISKLLDGISRIMSAGENFISQSVAELEPVQAAAMNAITRVAERISGADIYTCYDKSGNAIELKEATDGKKKITIVKSLRSLVESKMGKDLERFKEGQEVMVDFEDSLVPGKVVASLGSGMYKVEASGSVWSVNKSKILKR
jgi:hypothetical protein